MDWKQLLAYITGTIDQELLVRNQPFPLSLQAQCSLGQLHWPFVNIDAKIPPDLNALIFSCQGFPCSHGQCTVHRCAGPPHRVPRFHELDP